MADKETTFITELNEAATIQANLIEKYQSLRKTYFTRGYGTDDGNGNFPIDAATAAAGITTPEAVAMITLMENFINLATETDVDNFPVTRADYMATLAAIRTDM